MFIVFSAHRWKLCWLHSEEMETFCLVAVVVRGTLAAWWAAASPITCLGCSPALAPGSSVREARQQLWCVLLARGAVSPGVDVWG